MEKLTVLTFPLGPIQANCSILFCPKTKDAAIVDPGGTPEIILDEVDSRHLKVSKVLLTHGHFDHLLGLESLRNNLKDPFTISVHTKDLPLVESANAQGEMFGFSVPKPPPVDVPFSGAETLSIGENPIKVIWTPGHTPGSVCFYVPNSQLLLAGDTLFFRGVGRTDLPGGSADLIIKSIRDKLYILPPETTVICGHGPNTTIGAEMRSNPFARA